ncbi:MAG: PGF-pre-PGF domain-containing protein, partial [Halobacteria archaeon]|nr:PGF-pre-PGF domain-containing protein [Halobacteria archaeon]
TKKKVTNKTQVERREFKIAGVSRGSAIKTVYLNVPSGMKITVNSVRRDSLPSSVSSPPTNTVGLLEIDEVTIGATNTTGNITIEIAIERDGVGENVSPQVYRYHNSWRPLKTTVSNVTDSTVTVTAEAPGLSYFAVVDKADDSNKTATVTKTDEGNESSDTNETGDGEKKNQNPSPGFTVAVGLVAAVVAAVAVRRRSE